MRTIRTSNRYHKYTGFIQRRNATGYDDLQEPFRFNYLSDSIVDTSSNMFKTFMYTSQGTKLITEQYTGVAVNDRIIIDSNGNTTKYARNTRVPLVIDQLFDRLIKQRIYVVSEWDLPREFSTLRNIRANHDKDVSRCRLAVCRRRTQARL